MTARPTSLRLIVALLAASLPLGACDESSSDSSGPAVALFTNSDYVDYYTEEEEPAPPAGYASPAGEGDASDSEASNLEATFESFGATVTPFEGVTADDLREALADAQVLALPEPESGDYEEAFNGNATGEIVDFVDEGGRLVMFMAGNGRVLDFLNNAFGWSLTQGTEIPGDEPADSLFPAALAGYAHNIANAEGTPFSTGAEELPPNSLTLAVAISSLPGSAASMYDDQDDASALVVLPYGFGYVVIMGWDWFNAAPVGSKNGGWNPALNDAIRF